MRKILFAIVLLFITCNSSPKKNEVKAISQDVCEAREEIKYFEFSRFSSEPVNFDIHKYKAIKFDRDGTYSVEYTYNKGVLINSEILKSYQNKELNELLFSKVPCDYLKKNQSFGYPNARDEGGVMLKFDMINNELYWELNNDKSALPKELHPIYSRYLEMEKLLKE